MLDQDAIFTVDTQRRKTNCLATLASSVSRPADTSEKSCQPKAQLWGVLDMAQEPLNVFASSSSVGIPDISKQCVFEFTKYKSTTLKAA